MHRKIYNELNVLTFLAPAALAHVLNRDIQASRR
jgi:hypothetical protein